VSRIVSVHFELYLHCHCGDKGTIIVQCVTVLLKAVLKVLMTHVNKTICVRNIDVLFDALSLGSVMS